MNRSRTKIALEEQGVPGHAFQRVTDWHLRAPQP